MFSAEWLLKRQAGYLEADAEGEWERDEDQQHGEGGEQPAAHADTRLLLVCVDISTVYLQYIYSISTVYLQYILVYL